MNLQGRTVLITGGRRIGARLAVMLAERGCRVALSYHTGREAAEATVARCQGLGVAAAAWQADLRDPAQSERLLQQVLDQFSRVDMLVNLTSIYRPTPLSTLTATDYHDLVSSNLTAVAWLSVLAGQQMLRQAPIDGIRGKIIHFTDWSVDRPYRDFLPYLIGKGGVVTLTKALAVELAPEITVNAIAPGTVEPPPGTSDERLEQLRQATLRRAIGSPDDVNRAVLYLLEGTDFVTGEIYRVDGGRFLASPGEQGDYSDG